MRVTDVMSHPVFTIAPDASIKDAARQLIEHSVSALPVVDTSGRLVGIISEADLLSMETRPDPRTQATPLMPTAGSSPLRVTDVMTKKVVTVPTKSEVSQAARIMIESDIKRVPVMLGKRVVGIVSRRDLVRVIARRDEDLQKELERKVKHIGLGLPPGAVTVDEGIATISLDEREKGRELAESVALTVPGILEVRFANRKP
ncbi:MAG: CBS domain-containing protein [Candidatus Dormibacterales bacterium]